MNELECPIQRAILHFYNRVPGCVAVEYYNSAKWSTKHNKFMTKNQTFRPDGFPDILVWYRGNAFCVETKSNIGVVSKPQRRQHARLWDVAGIRTYICRNIYDAEYALNRERAFAALRS